MRAGADGALDVLHPLIMLVRGLARLTMLVLRWWAKAPKDRRGPVLFLAAVGVMVVGLLPWGPAFAVAVVVGTAAWHGREGARPAGGPGCEDAENERLQAVYEALVPCFALRDDPGPEPLYAHDGAWERAFEEVEFTDDGRIGRLLVRYPAHFPDSDSAHRLAVERRLTTKSGRDREYRFAWHEERNLLEMTVPQPLPQGISAQRFVTGPGEIVLGFTDAEAVHRRMPVADGGRARDVPPVVWRTGARSAQPHLLVAGAPGAGSTTLLRSVVLQALQHGEVLVVDGGGSGEFASLAGREGVLAVETSPAGAVASLEWAVHETERRLSAASRARQAGRPVPEDVRRPLWVVLDRPATLSHLARAEGRRDPQELLQVPLRHGRAAQVTVAVAEHLENADGLARAVRSYTRARVLLGAASPEETWAVLGEATVSRPGPDAPPGRGFARLGAGAVLRLQVPAAPDPLDDAAGEAERQAVLALLPPFAAAHARALGGQAAQSGAPDGPGHRPGTKPGAASQAT
ncbi:hypothetical protein DB35_05640 [Streptomyces abyssalis]|uniref:FtsK domain-containing protein n=1 Tax=Streptomyces abyssalis TaxID=933944 RepID=A0A1E7JTV6_9ACTN|nr:hypothetical protein AN215_07100 [Streptomyces abyssalis]OEU94736.1 hypothetical protein DB35_05640 [Streptomyces abyssalis]